MRAVVGVVALVAVQHEQEFGGKAAQLGAALRAGLSVPNGVALSAVFVEALGAGDNAALSELERLHASFDGPVAARSSAVGEDSAQVSFAGQHRTYLNIGSAPALAEAVRAIWRSATGEAALAYRRRLAVEGMPLMGVVVQTQIDPSTAGVLFTRNPVSGTDERVIEATWGLGEAVAAGLVIPDRYRISRQGDILERAPGAKTVAIRVSAQGGTVQQPVADELVERLCLDDEALHQLHELACRCEELHTGARDLEWAFAGDTLSLLQTRAVTRGGASTH